MNAMVELPDFIRTPATARTHSFTRSLTHAEQNAIERASERARIRPYSNANAYLHSKCETCSDYFDCCCCCYYLFISTFNMQVNKRNNKPTIRRKESVCLHAKRRGLCQPVKQKPI